MELIYREALELGISAPPAAAPASKARPRPGAADRPEPERAPGVEPRSALVQRVCLRVPPAFPLEELVAVNPFLGYADKHLLTASEEIGRRLHAHVLPRLSAHHRAWRAGEFSALDLERARDELGAGPFRDLAPGLDVAAIAGELDRAEPDAAEATAPGDRVESLAARLDRAAGAAWTEAIVADIGRFCAARFDRGVARWGLPLAAGGLYAAWRAYASHDRSMEARGLKGFRAWAKALPADADAALAALLEAIDLPISEHEDYLSRLLGEAQGWAGYLRYLAWKSAPDATGELPELLAVRLAYDAALQRLYQGAGREALRVEARPPAPSEDAEAAARRRLARYLALTAAERGYNRRLLAKLDRPGHRASAGAAAARAAAERPAVQAVFCIDVRAEPLRRHLEAVDSSIDTYGFAGFFGLPIEVVSPDSAAPRTQCPVLLKPGHRVAQNSAPRGAASRFRARTAKQASAALSGFRRSANACFSYVETLGFASVVPMLAETFGLRAKGSPAPGDEAPHDDLDLSALTHEDRIALTRGMLKNLGLERPLGRILLLCGHESTSANNPQAAALACGACAGHSGAVNARIAARLLNDPAVRAELSRLGCELPSDCVAVAAVHDTAVDQIRILDRDRTPPSHLEALRRLEGQLAEAGARLRAERASSLPGLDRAAQPEALRRALQRRSRDWAEVRPEWGLANNASFVVAPRARTRGVDLEGRAFLHSYDQDRDPDNSVLELVLTAPVVVGSWINLQYYASTVDPIHFGSGTKTIHNVVGGVGVLLGNEGDLAVGLSLQSVHDGDRPRHEPLRLQVFVEADPPRIEAVLAKHAPLRALVDNGWIVLHSIEPRGDRCSRYMPGHGWSEER